MRVELAIALIFATIGASAQDNEHVFEPGTKHACTPAADRRSWVCSASDPADARGTPTGSRDTASRDAPARAETASKSAPHDDTVSAPPPAAPRSSRSVPSYLLAPESRTSSPPQSGPAPIPAKPAPVKTPSIQQPTEPAASAPSDKPAAASVPPPATSTPEPAKPVQPSRPLETAPPSRSTPAAALDNDAFRAIAPSAFVLELAHGSSREAVAGTGTGLALPHGRTYLLHLLHDGSDWFVLAWGEFDSLESARAARDEATAAGVSGVGFPRRAGPLQEEIRRARR